MISINIPMFILDTLLGSGFTLVVDKETAEQDTISVAGETAKEKLK